MNLARNGFSVKALHLNCTGSHDDDDDDGVDYLKLNQSVVSRYQCSCSCYTELTHVCPLFWNCRQTVGTIGVAHVSRPLRIRHLGVDGGELMIAHAIVIDG